MNLSAKMSLFLLLVGVVILSGINVAAVLLPFGVSSGDELVPPADDGSSAPQNKLALSGTSCPFYGVDENTIYVSM